MAIRLGLALSAEDFLSMRASTDPDIDAALQAWIDLIESTPFDEIGPNTQRVLPMIFANLRSRPSFLERDRLKGAFRYTWTRNSTTFFEARSLFAALNDTDTSYRLLKGSAIQATTGLVGSRIMGDIDLLVAEKSIDSVSTILRNLGFRRNSHQECVRHTELGHEEALNFNRGSLHVDLHVAELKPPTRLFVNMLEAEPRLASLAGVAVLIPEPELIGLHAAVHGVQASGQTDLMQAAVDLSVLSRSIDQSRLLELAARTKTTSALIHLSREISRAGLPTLDVQIPARSLAQERIDVGAANSWAKALGATRFTRKIRDRSHPVAGGADFSGFQAGNLRYRLWTAMGQQARFERLLSPSRRGFLQTPPDVTQSGAEFMPFEQLNRSWTSSRVAPNAIDWRFRVKLSSRVAKAKALLSSTGFENLDAMIFLNCLPVARIVAGDSTTLEIHFEAQHEELEFSIRPLWAVCESCYSGFADLVVAIEYQGTASA